MSANTEPKLAPPGAGLPALELCVGRMLFAVRRWTSNRDAITARFQQERAAMRQLVQSHEARALTQRVLIRRPPGLEDSSRYWSIVMTLDHLRIVNQAMAGIIESLAQGKIPEGTASTAAVKPSPEATPEAIAAYEQSCDDLLAVVATATNLKTAARFAHPWFGPLNAAGWHVLSAGHMRIHRVQIERIAAGWSSAA